MFIPYLDSFKNSYDNRLFKNKNTCAVIIAILSYVQYKLKPIAKEIAVFIKYLNNQTGLRCAPVYGKKRTWEKKTQVY